MKDVNIYLTKYKCPICYSWHQITVHLDCRHYMCYYCFEQYRFTDTLRNKCHICRRLLTNTNHMLFMTNTYTNSVTHFTNLDQYDLDSRKYAIIDDRTVNSYTIKPRLSICPVVNDYNDRDVDQILGNLSVKINNLHTVSYFVYVTLPFLYLAIFL